MSEKLYVPTSSEDSDTLVISYYPLGGNDANTGPRYQEEATETGFHILGITRVGSDTTKFDRSLRKKLSPENFDESWQEYAADLDEKAKNYDYVIARGQSTGSFPTLNIVKNGLVRATHLLLEDGVNTRQNWRGRQKNPISAKADWAIGMFSEKIVHKPGPLDPEWQKPQSEPTDKPAIPKTIAEKLRNFQNAVQGVGKFAIEVAHWAPLWQSDYSQTATFEIARRRQKLPMLYKFLGHTATSKPDEAKRFIEALSEINQERHANPDQSAEVRGEFDADAWHGTLEYSQYGTQNLLAVRRMQSLVTK